MYKYICKSWTEWTDFDADYVYARKNGNINICMYIFNAESCGMAFKNFFYFEKTQNGELALCWKDVFAGLLRELLAIGYLLIVGFGFGLEFDIRLGLRFDFGFRLGCWLSPAISVCLGLCGRFPLLWCAKWGKGVCNWTWQSSNGFWISHWVRFLSKASAQPGRFVSAFQLRFSRLRVLKCIGEPAKLFSSNRIHKPTQAQNSKAFRMPFSTAISIGVGVTYIPIIAVWSAAAFSIEMHPSLYGRNYLNNFGLLLQLSTLNLITNYYVTKLAKLFYIRNINILCCTNFLAHKLKHCKVLSRNIFGYETQIENAKEKIIRGYEKGRENKLFR